MADEIPPPAPAVPEPVQTHPGDILQVTDQAHPAFPAILLVWEVRGAHVEARLQSSRDQEHPPVRVKPGQFAIVGAAALLVSHRCSTTPARDAPGPRGRAPRSAAQALRLRPAARELGLQRLDLGGSRWGWR